MTNIMHKQIINLFNNPINTINGGLWFSGYTGEGEYKQWDKNGKLTYHFYFKNAKVIKDYLKSQ